MRDWRKARRARFEPRPEFKEGFLFDGVWWPPEQVHEVCRLRMESFDRAPREVRDRVNENGS
jgi:hypothetical protein